MLNNEEDEDVADLPEIDSKESNLQSLEQSLYNHLSQHNSDRKTISKAKSQPQSQAEFVDINLNISTGIDQVKGVQTQQAPLQPRGSLISVSKLDEKTNSGSDTVSDDEISPVKVPAEEKKEKSDSENFSEQQPQAKRRSSIQEFLLKNNLKQ